MMKCGVQGQTRTAVSAIKEVCDEMEPYSCQMKMSKFLVETGFKQTNSLTSVLGGETGSLYSIVWLDNE